MSVMATRAFEPQFNQHRVAALSGLQSVSALSLIFVTKLMQSPCCLCVCMFLTSFPLLYGPCNIREAYKITLLSVNKPITFSAYGVIFPSMYPA
jgi:hypothetical protein